MASFKGLSLSQGRRAEPGPSKRAVAEQPRCWRARRRLAIAGVSSEMHQQSSFVRAISSLCERSERAPKCPMPVSGLMHILKEIFLIFCYPFCLGFKFPLILASFCQLLFLHGTSPFQFSPVFSPTIFLCPSFLFHILHMKPS